MVLGLLDRIVNAHRIDPRDPRLHLKLGVVNPRLKIEELAGQMVHASLPGLPKVVRQKADQHGPHPESSSSPWP